MNLQLQRKLDANWWIIRSRWFYVSGIVLIGILTKLEPHTYIDLSWTKIFGLGISMWVINAVFYFAVKKSPQNQSVKYLNRLGYTQLSVELLFIAIIIHNAGGIESIASIFFFLPIVSASLLFGSSGSFVVSFLASMLLMGIVVLEHYGIVPHIYRYGVITAETEYLLTGLNHAFTTSIFYFLVGVFSGRGSKMLFAREEQVIAEQKKTASILTNLIDPIIVIDNNNQINFVNPAFSKIFRVDKNLLNKQISPRNFFSMNNFTDLMGISLKVKQIKSNDPKKHLEEIKIKSKNQEITFKVTTVDVIDEKDQKLGVLKIFYDLTREYNIDKLKSEFITIAAHQLRTPLSAVKWIIRMVLDEEAGKINNKQKDLLDKGYDRNEYMISLVDDLLNVSSIEEGRFNYFYHEKNIGNLILKIIESFSIVAREKNIKLFKRLLKTESVLKIDEEKMIIAIGNIIDNAIKYTPPKGKITVSTSREDNYFILKIKNSGAGISEKDMKKIFSKFFRSQKILSMETKGSGLGLYLAKNIIEAHGGTIDIKSKENHWTEATIKLPINIDLKKINKSDDRGFIDIK